MSHNFNSVWPSDWNNVLEATLTVYSQANQNGWGASLGGGGGSAVATYLPTADGLETGAWNTNPCWDDVDEYPTPDDATTFMTGVTNGYMLFTSTQTVPAAATNIDVIVYYRARDAVDGVNVVSSALRVGGMDYVDTDAGNNPPITTAAWQTFSYNYTTNPNSLAEWTADDINGVGASALQQFGVEGDDLNPDANVTQCYMVITYDVPPAANDDQWVIDYTLDGSAWTSVISTTASETALTAHIQDLGSTLTTINANNFRARAWRKVVGTADSSGTIDWGYSKLDLRYTRPVTVPGGLGGGPTLMCASCHNVHRSTLNTMVADPENTYNEAGYGADAENNVYCMKCHGATQPTRTNTAATYAPASVVMTADGMDKSAYGARGHWSVYGSIDSGEARPVPYCHDKHGSKYPKLVGVYDAGTDSNRIPASRSRATTTASARTRVTRCAPALYPATARRHAATPAATRSTARGRDRASTTRRTTRRPTWARSTRPRRCAGRRCSGRAATARTATTSTAPRTPTTSCAARRRRAVHAGRLQLLLHVPRRLGGGGLRTSASASRPPRAAPRPTARSRPTASGTARCPRATCRPTRRCRATTATTRTARRAPYGLHVVTQSRAARRSRWATGRTRSR